MLHFLQVARDVLDDGDDARWIRAAGQVHLQVLGAELELFDRLAGDGSIDLAFERRLDERPGHVPVAMQRPVVPGR